MVGWLKPHGKAREGRKDCTVYIVWIILKDGERRKRRKDSERRKDGERKKYGERRKDGE